MLAASRKAAAAHNGPRLTQQRAGPQRRGVTAAAVPEAGSGAHRALCAGLAALTVAGAAASPALAAGRTKVGEFAASGLLFKDSVEVTALDDADVPGVVLYISDFKRSLADKLSKDFFSEPSQASLTCTLTTEAFNGIPDPKKLEGGEGREVFSEKKGLSIFKDKTLRVRRLYDPDRRNLLYVAYSTRLSTAADDKGVSTGRYRTSLCTVHLPEAPPVAVPAQLPAVTVSAE
ncbi:hypothetical protein Rsub_11919 [Raphidocelis subcapitata]|uniref:Uncharacterized protein n=1 Tax=Raphidocelis subcapitata TaxID=307507 RepID=A0A2V0PMJ7_9CHLO|nr:hypothetical protein Rsub_11919 [Raphidocelis subcapitata]|eukprot:GBF99110.1 hypothetical protein Rsub_11919 [Raphidocelis subcapitata]